MTIPRIQARLCCPDKLPFCMCISSINPPPRVRVAATKFKKVKIGCQAGIGRLEYILDMVKIKIIPEIVARFNKTRLSRFHFDFTNRKKVNSPENSK